jgi:uncharacterized protein YciI
MFIISLTYKAPLEDIDAAMKEHISYLKKYYEEGKFLLSGRKVPRKGGIIIATAKNKIEVRKIAKEDPFYKKGLAGFTITEFNASQVNDNIAELIK